ncbi:MAG: SAM-dependent methyltransferase, partial [Pseudomonadota bacterium]
MATRGAELLHAGARFGSRPGLFSRLLAPGFRRLLQRIDAGLATGQINGLLPDGSRIVLGGRVPGFTGEIHLKDWRGLLRLATGGSAGWYQAWEAGEWTSPDPVPLFALFAVNGATLGEVGRAKGPWRWGAR